MRLANEISGLEFVTPFAGRAMQAVDIPVSYRFSEYHAFALEHIERTQRSRPSYMGRMVIYLSALAVFGLKTWKIPWCEFRIDEAGIRRKTARGELHFPWSDMKAIHRFAPGYLFELGKGAIPIPYRCVDPREAARLAEFLAAKQRELAARG